LKSQGVVLKPNEILKYNNQTLTGGKLETYNITDFALIDIEGLNIPLMNADIIRKHSFYPTIYTKKNNTKSTRHASIF